MAKQKWYEQATFYHIYPLGFCGDQIGKQESPIKKITQHLEYIHQLGFTGIYLGPLFESISHGYDTTDYFKVDGRLGNNNDLLELVQKAHDLDMRVILDGVFNHVGRNFFAFRDILEKRQDSQYLEWFTELNFHSDNHHHDGFSYHTWENHEELVQLNLRSKDVKNHLFEAIGFWVRTFNIDGLRLDAADCLDLDFLRHLRHYTSTLKEDFWLMGEIIHGDYNRWACEDKLHSVTNYECYKGLYSSFNDRNFYEIAYSLNRQFGKGGIYYQKHHYNFLDNHDVDRITSKLANPNDLFPLHILLYTIPGVPSIYYGSEWAITGKRTPFSDLELRPVFDLEQFKKQTNYADLSLLIQRLNTIRKKHTSFSEGDFSQIYLDHSHLIFKRETDKEIAYIGINASDQEFVYYFEESDTGQMDILNKTKPEFTNGRLTMRLFKNWGSIIVQSK